MSTLWKETALIRALAVSKIPLLFFARPSVAALTDESCVIRFPFSRMNRNHVGSMYVGVLCMGADLASGWLTAKHLRGIKNGKGVLVFKDLQAKFLKRAEGETYFTCEEGRAIQEAVKRAEETRERVDVPVRVVATTPEKFGDEPVAEFVLTVSIKVR